MEIFFCRLRLSYIFWCNKNAILYFKVSITSITTSVIKSVTVSVNWFKEINSITMITASASIIEYHIPL